MGYSFIIKRKLKEGRGKIAFFLILPVNLRLTSLAPPLYWGGECLTL